MTSTNNLPNREDYVAKVLQWFVELPETPWRSRQPDLVRAAELHSRGVGLEIVESAFLLGSLRRLGRPPDHPPLQPIRSLAYFLPVVEELIETPVDANYLDYLRHKMRIYGGQKRARKCG